MQEADCCNRACKEKPSCRPELHAKGVFAQRGYHKMAPCTACTIKTSQTLLQVQEDDQSSPPHVTGSFVGHSPSDMLCPPAR